VTRAAPGTDSPREPEIARAFGGRWIPLGLGVVAVVYFVFVFAEAAKSGTAARFLPAPLAYFTQIAALFPGAAKHSIDYRVEGYSCKERSFSEIDVRPWFPIDADNKENRFYRAMHFFGEHPHRETLRALDEFITSHYETDRIAAAARGEARPALGGVRFVRVRSSIGEAGDVDERYEKKPLTSFSSEDRHDLYYTPESRSRWPRRPRRSSPGSPWRARASRSPCGRTGARRRASPRRWRAARS
jgi:hypothetical protein